MTFLRELVVFILLVGAIITMPVGILLAAWRRSVIWFNLVWLSVVLIIFLAVFGGIVGGRIFTSKLERED
jgi:hypothetical protein